MLVEELRSLVALADHPRLTDAALALGTSQPTLSRLLARVERELGVRLVERDARGIRLNPYGELAVAAARELTARYDRLQRDLAGLLDPEAGTVRLAFLDSLATSLVPQLLREFHEHAPRARVLLRQESAHEVVQDLARGAADLAVTAERPPGAYGWVRLQEERLVLVVPPQHRLHARARVDLQELAGEELVTVPVGYGYRQLVDGLLRAAGVAPAISFESQDLATIEGLVAAGLGVGIVPEVLAGVSGTVGIRLTAPGARRTVGLTWRTDRTLPPAAQRFRDLVETGPGSTTSRGGTASGPA